MVRIRRRPPPMEDKDNNNDAPSASKTMYSSVQQPQQQQQQQQQEQQQQQQKQRQHQARTVTKRRLPIHNSNNKHEAPSTSETMYFKTPLGISKRDLDFIIKEVKKQEKDFNPTILNKKFDEMAETYAPTFAMITTFIHLAMNSSRHFNTDSIALIQTLADQVGLSIVDFLDKLKTYRLLKSGGLPPYGFRFQFAKMQPSGGEIQSVAPEIEKAVLGLKITCVLLQQAAKSSSSKAFIKVGRKKESESDEMVFGLIEDGGRKATSGGNDSTTTNNKKKENPNSKHNSKEGRTENVDVTKSGERTSSKTRMDNAEVEKGHKNNDTTTTTNLADNSVNENDPKDEKRKRKLPIENQAVVPMVRTHKINSWDKRLWLNVEHRLNAFQGTTFIFNTVLGPEAPTVDHLVIKLGNGKRKKVSVAVRPDYEKYLNLSYRLTANCKERRFFLRVWTNIYLLFPSKAAILAHRTRLKDIWDRQQDVSIGIALQDYVDSEVDDTTDSLVFQIDKAFNYFRGCRSKNISQKGDGESIEYADNEWWQCLRVNTFRHFLEFDPNSHLKTNLRKLWDDMVAKKAEEREAKSAAEAAVRARILRTRKAAAANAAAAAGREKLFAKATPKQVASDSDSNEDDDKEDEWTPEPTSEDEEGTESSIPKSPPPPTAPTVLPSARGGSKRMGNTIVMDPKEPLFLRVPGGPPDLPNLKDIDQLLKERQAFKDASGEAKTNSLKLGEVESSLPSLSKNPEVCDRFQLALLDDLSDAKVDSGLMIKDPNRGKYHLSLSNFEFYLATLLKHRAHLRWIRRFANHLNLPKLTQMDCHHYIGNQKVESIDRDANVLHVARFGSPVVNDFVPKLDVAALSQALVIAGGRDKSRSPDGFTIHVAAAGPMSYNKGGRPKAVGMGPDDFLTDKPSLRKMIGQWLVYKWRASQTILAKAKFPLMAIRKEFSDEVKRYFFIDDDIPMGFESITLKFQELSPYLSANIEHYDVHNCGLPTTCHTAASDICLIDPVTGRLYLLQMITNFRVAITSYCMPFYRSVQSLSRHMLKLIQLINSRMNELFRGRQFIGPPPTALDLTNFFIDDSLKSHQEVLHIGSTGKITIDVIKLPIGFSRVFSLSCALHVLHELQEFLDRKAIIELCFVASMLNTPLRFYFSLTRLLTLAREQRYKFDEHPFNDWYRMTIQLFSQWQGGPNPRYSCAGIADIGAIFGDSPLDGLGNQRLELVVDVLTNFLDWVDGQVSKVDRSSLPIPWLEQKFKMVCEDLKFVAGNDFKDFGLFRLGIFMTHAFGAGLTLPGPHLRHLFFPSKGMASFWHLKQACSDCMSKEEASQIRYDRHFRRNKSSEKYPVIPQDKFDTATDLVCEDLDIAEDDRCREFMEGGTCESRPSRSLNLMDALPIRSSIFRWKGFCIERKFPGEGQPWKVIPHHRKPYVKTKRTSAAVKQLPMISIPRRIRKQLFLNYEVNDVVLQCLADGFSKAARRKVTDGTVQRLDSYQDPSTDPEQGQLHYYHHTLHCYESDAVVGNSSTNHMRVLPNNNFAAIDLTKSGFQFESFGSPGSAFIEYSRRKPSMPSSPGELLAGTVHLQGNLKEEEKGLLSFYPLHKDKTTFDWVTFVPLQGDFWTVLATPVGLFDSMVHGDDDLRDRIQLCNRKYQTFVKGLDSEQKSALESFLENSKKVARKVYKSLGYASWDNIELNFCFCNPGTMLSFVAKEIMHGTITMNGDQLRDLVILHSFLEE